MADAGNAAAGGLPTLGIISQYVKDLSFENPGAPGSLQPRQKQPVLTVNVGVTPSQINATDYEVQLKLDASAKDGDTVLFAIELVYAGAFRMTNVPAGEVQAIVMVECPRLLFPFARQVLASASINGGFPPLMLDPIDFATLYRQRLAAEQDQRARSV